MVKSTRAASGPGDLRPLNKPQALDAKVGRDGCPEDLKIRGKWVEVEFVVGRWRIEDEWWREQPVSRMYYQCIVDQGLKVTVFQDLVTGRWYHQRH